MTQHWHGPKSQAAADFVEGRLKDRRLFEEHLKECLDVEALRRIKGRTRSWDEEEPYQRQHNYRPLFSGLALALPTLLTLAWLYMTARPPISHRKTGSTGKVVHFHGQTVNLGPQTQVARLQANKANLNTDRLNIETDQTDLEVHRQPGRGYPTAAP